MFFKGPPAPLFAYFATQLLTSSLMDSRYMTLIFLPYFLIGSLAVSMLKTKITKQLFIVFIIFFYFIQTLIPNFFNTAHFAKRISHNWRYALYDVKTHIRPDDSIVLRSGFIKENWLPATENRIIKEYVQAPLKSFYFKGVTPKAIYNLTFSPSIEFKSYYKKIVSRAVQSNRIWIIGIKQPNNFPMENIPELFLDTHKVVSNKDFDGVFVTLMVKRR